MAISCDICGENVKGSKSMNNYHLDCYLKKMYPEGVQVDEEE